MTSHPILIGIPVTCQTCRRMKQPHGRSAPMGSSYCDSKCEGYRQEPKPGCLWPGETDVDFGYPCCELGARWISEEER